MISDQESQEDELLALASIYDDESFLVTSPGDEGDMAGGQFSAQLELPQPFHVLFSSPQKGRKYNQGSLCFEKIV